MSPQASLTLTFSETLLVSGDFVHTYWVGVVPGILQGQVFTFSWKYSAWECVSSFSTYFFAQPVNNMDGGQPFRRWVETHILHLFGPQVCPGSPNGSILHWLMSSLTPRVIVCVCVCVRACAHVPVCAGVHWCACVCFDRLFTFWHYKVFHSHPA